MRLSPFVWLGAGRARKRGVGEATAVLDMVARAGLPVPTGAILLDDLFHILRDEDVIGFVEGRVVAPDPIWLQQILQRDVRLPQIKELVNVFPAAADRLGKPGMPAVDFAVPDQMALALCAAWSDIPEQERHDVLLLATVDAQVQGTAVLTEDGPAAVEVWIGSGLEQRLALPPLRAFQRPDPDLPLYGQRLQKLLRGLRRTLDAGSWRVVWIDDGAVCWVTAVGSEAV